MMKAVLLMFTLLAYVHANVLKTVNFNNAQLGQHDVHDSFGGNIWYQTVALSRSEILSSSGNKYWQTKFPAGCSIGGCGAQLVTKGIFGSVDELWLSYGIQVDNNFEFSSTGVLPGLCGGDCDTQCSGAPSDSRGWSVRYSFDTTGALYGHVFDMDRTPDACGFDFPLRNADDTPMRLERGKWHNLEMRIKLNSSPSNGILELYLDSERGLQKNDITYRGNTAINKVELYLGNMFYSFDKSTRVSYVSYDNFVFSTERQVLPTSQPTSYPTSSPTKTPTRAPTTKATVTTTLPTSTISPTSAPTDSETTPIGGEASNETLNGTTVAAISVVCAVVGVAGFGISRIRRRDAQPNFANEYLPRDNTPGLRQSVADRVRSLFASKSPAAKLQLAAAQQRKTSKLRIQVPVAETIHNPSFSVDNPVYHRQGTAGSWTSMHQAPPAVNDFECSCGDESAGMVPIRALKRAGLEVLARHLGIVFKKGTSTEALYDSVSLHPRWTVMEPSEARLGRVSVCRTCLKSQSPNV